MKFKVLNKIRCHGWMMLILSVCLAMSGCGGSSSSAAEEVVEEEMETAEESFSEETSWEDTEDVGMSSDETFEDTEILSNAFGMVLTGATEFRNDVAWIRYDEEGRAALSVIDTDGQILFTVYAEGVLYCAPFEDGVSFYAGKDPDSGERYEVIVDRNGNECYRAGMNPASGAAEEHILCYGNGRFILARHTSGMTADEWQIGAIDAYGSELCEFQHCENAKVMGYFQTDKMNVYYDSYKDYDGNTWSVSRYLGDDIYYLHTGNMNLMDECLYNAATGAIQIGAPDGYSIMFPQEIVDGHLVTLSSGRNSVLVMTEDFEPEGEFETFSDKWDDIDAKFRNGLFYSAHGNYDNPYNLDYRRGYYDLYGNMVISLDNFYPELDSLDIWGFPFYDGYAAVQIRGQDHKMYVTVINESGEEQFTPMQIDSVRLDGEFHNGCFVVKAEDGSRLFVNTSGEIVHNFSDDLPESYAFWLSEPYSVLRYGAENLNYFSYFLLSDVLAAGGDHYELSMPAVNMGQTGENIEKSYSYVSGLTIEGKWKSTGSYGFGQAQPGAIVAFDGINCNFFSPQDTYAFYPDGDWYTA